MKWTKEKKGKEISLTTKVEKATSFLKKKGWAKRVFCKTILTKKRETESPLSLSFKIKIKKNKFFLP